MLISSFFWENETTITPLLLFHLDLGLVCNKLYRFLQYTSLNCFNNFVQPAVIARREGHENPNSSIVAETMKVLVNSSYGYQTMNRSRHTATKHTNAEKTHGAIDNKMFKRLGYKNDQLYEVEVVKSEIEHKEPIIIWFFILQYAKLRKLQLYSNFFDKYGYVKKCEELEMDTDSLYLALSKYDLYDRIEPARKKGWNSLQSADCRDEFSANSTTNFFPRDCCAKHRKHDRREPGLLKEESRCKETYCCYDSQSNRFRFSSKGLNNRTLEDCSNGPMCKYRNVLESIFIVTSTNRSFRTI